MQTDLTHRQQEIYNWLFQFWLSHGYSPTVREIGEQFDIKSPNGVVSNLRALEAKGYITWRPDSARTIVTRDARELLRLAALRT